MSVILFYTSIRTRVKDQESLMTEFVKAGHQVYFLNQQVNPYLPSLCERAGVTYRYVSVPSTRFTWLRIFFYCFHLIRFVHTHKVDVIYSHLEPANFIAVLSQYFLRARVVIVRHHLDLAEHMGFGKDFSYKLTYQLAQNIIAVSAASKRYMVEREGIRATKIHHINLGYDFSVFGTYTTEGVKQIRSKHSGSLILVSVGRLDPYKRPELSVEVCKALIDKGIKTHLFLLGSGENEITLKEKIVKLELQDHIELLGYTDQVMDYLKASDWLLHPSISESSCVVVKEAALAELPSIVCSNVGDFDDYMIDRINSILVDQDHFVEQAISAILEFQHNLSGKKELGVKLKSVIESNFGIASVMYQYNQFLR